MTIKQTTVNYIKEKSLSGCDSIVSLNDDLQSQLKSFDFMLLILELERKFNFKLSIEKISPDIVTVAQFINWTEQQYAQK